MLAAIVLATGSATFLSPAQLNVGHARNRLQPAMTPTMFFGPRGDPVEVELKTFDGIKTVQGTAGQSMMKVVGSSGLIYGCKTGECGTCEVISKAAVTKSCALLVVCVCPDLFERQQ